MIWFYYRFQSNFRSYQRRIIGATNSLAVLLAFCTFISFNPGEADESDPFAGTSAEYVARKEEQIEKRRNRKVSAQRQQIDKDNELWERNRMLTSGVVHAININSDLDEVSWQSHILFFFFLFSVSSQSASVNTT